MDDIIARFALFLGTRKNINNIRNNTWFPIGGKFVCFYHLRLEFISNNKKRIFSMQKCPSLSRALRNERIMNSRWVLFLYATYCCSVFGLCG